MKISKKKLFKFDKYKMDIFWAELEVAVYFLLSLLVFVGFVWLAYLFAFR